MATNPLTTLPTAAADTLRVEETLLSTVHIEGDPYLTEIASHLIKAGGKRLRPRFAIAAAACALPDGVPVSLDVVRGGVSVELVHIGSLYHDDVMDEAVLRRQVESVNARWGNLRAILAGDYLLAKASEIAADLGVEVAGLLATTIGKALPGSGRRAPDPLRHTAQRGSVLSEHRGQDGIAVLRSGPDRWHRQRTARLLHRCADGVRSPLRHGLPGGR